MLVTGSGVHLRRLLAYEERPFRDSIRDDEMWPECCLRKVEPTFTHRSDLCNQ